MTTLKQHFLGIKRVTDWSWTIALLCLVGYLSFGQVAQLYFVMIFFGGVAGSFSVFYKISCEKIKEIDSLNLDELEKALESSYQAVNIVDSYLKRNQYLAKSNINRSDLIQSIHDIQHEIKEEIKKEKQIFHKNTQPSRKPIQVNPKSTVRPKGKVYVKGHYREGKWIRPHWRSRKKK